MDIPHVNKIGVVILNYNDSETSIKLISSLEKYDIVNRIVIVDNCSTDDSFTILSQNTSSKVEVVKSARNGGYGYGNNYGIRYLNETVHPSHILIANPDVEIAEVV